LQTIDLKPGVVTEIPIDQVLPDAHQPRQTFRPKPLDELAANIAARGVLQAITVVPSGPNEFLIKTGERRWRASKAAGDSNDLLIDQLAENNLREDLDPVDRATALKKLRDKGLSLKEVGALLEQHGMTMSRSAISNSLRLLKLPEETLERVRAGELVESVARELVAIAEYPDIVDEISKGAVEEKWERVDPEYIRWAIDDELGIVCERVQKGDGCENCECMLTVTDGNGNKIGWCKDSEKLKAKRVDALAQVAGNDGEDSAETPKKKAETDPAKVAPKKIKPAKGGAVALQRRNYDLYHRLRSASFDTEACNDCPHNHNASYDGDSERAERTCFYPPCYNNLARQHAKAEKRRERILEIIDNQLLPHLVDTCKQPVAETIVLPLLAYIASDYPVEGTVVDHDHHFMRHCAAPGNWSDDCRRALEALPATLNRGTLTAYLSSDLSGTDAECVVEAAIRSLDIPQRRELALYLSIEIGSFWETSDDYVKLFTKPEIVELIGYAFDPPDVPAGEWRDRLMLRPGVPDMVRELWASPIENIHQAGDEQ